MYDLDNLTGAPAPIIVIPAKAEPAPLSPQALDAQGAPIDMIND